jgi:hypothetical protein
MTALNHELFYAPTPNAVISQIAIEVMSQKAQSLVLTQFAFEILDQYSPFVRMTRNRCRGARHLYLGGRLTAIAGEVLDVYTPNLRLTQDAAEVLYQYIAPTDINFTTSIPVTQTIQHSSFINRTVVSNITVGQIIAGQEYPKSVTTSIAVAQTIVARNSTIHASVTTNITVTPTVRVNRDHVLRT